MARWEPVLEQVMRERSARLLAYARLLTGSTAEAEDVLQDALVRSFSRGRSFPDADRAEAYVRRSIPSVFIDRLRSRRSREAAHERLAHATDLTAEPADVAEALDVRAALAELSPRERACMVLRFYDDLTVPQVADTLRLAEGTVKRYLSDASSRMAATLRTDVVWEHADTVPVRATTRGGR